MGRGNAFERSEVEVTGGRGLLRVIKVGGSLFDLERLANRIKNWIEQQSPAANLLIPGGGAPVDCIRELQKASCFEDRTAHWAAIKQLDENAKMLKDSLPEMLLIDDLSMFKTGSIGEHRDYILAPNVWLQCNSRLPESWEATSDSISAEVATAIQNDGNAVELVLLKSCLPDVLNPGSLWRGEWVDPCFFDAARDLRTVRIVNLRSDRCQSLVLRELTEPS